MENLKEKDNIFSIYKNRNFENLRYINLDEIIENLNDKDEII